MHSWTTSRAWEQEIRGSQRVLPSMIFSASHDESDVADTVVAPATEEDKSTGAHKARIPQFWRRASPMQRPVWLPCRDPIGRVGNHASGSI